MSCFRLNRNPGPKGSHFLKKWNSVIIVLLIFTGCKSQYKHLQPSSGDPNCVKAVTPQFGNSLYSAIIDVTKFHFSGILYIKSMPDSSLRIVFTNEMGIKFFDFAFSKDGGFTKKYILPKMDKKAVVKALRNDLQLVLLNPDLRNAKIMTDNVYRYTAVPNKKGNDYYITDPGCRKLVRIEKASKRKTVVVAELMNYRNGTPDSINVHHKNFKFNISLKRVER